MTLFSAPETLSYAAMRSCIFHVTVIDTSDWRLSNKIALGSCRQEMVDCSAQDRYGRLDHED